MCGNKETALGIYRNEVTRAMLTIKGDLWEKKKKKKKKMGLLFWGSGTPTFWLGFLLFIKGESQIPAFKMLVRTLWTSTNRLEDGQCNRHIQERREIQTKQLSASFPDLYMLQDRRAHCYQQHPQTPRWAQHRFRARSCETQLLTLADELVSGLDKKQQHNLIVLDFSKALDCMPHQRLLRFMSI